MAAEKRKEYEVEINGIAHTMLLSSEDAERYGDLAKAVAPANKARAAAANKAAAGSSDSAGASGGQS